MHVKASEIAAFLGASLHGPDVHVERPATLDSAGPNTVVFLKKPDPALVQNITVHTSILAILPEGLEADGISVINSANPRLTFARILEEYFKKPLAAERIAKTASIDPTASLGKNVRVGHYSVIGAGAVIGDDTEIRHHVVIAPGVQIGSNCLIKSGAVIGEEGFGMVKDDHGHNMRIPHVGSVIIGDRVEVGALNTVACGTIDPTIIADGCKLDDHVHIAHNVRMGPEGIITACVEISGSVTVGKDVWIGPNSSVMHGIAIGDGAYIGLGAVVAKPVDPKAVMGGARATFLRYTD